MISMLMVSLSHTGMLHASTSGHMLVVHLTQLVIPSITTVPVSKALQALHLHYVGTDYYCESGIKNCSPWNIVAAGDPLWDGQQCSGGEAPCCTHPNMPWFIKTLNETTTEDIELRLCKIGNKVGQEIRGDTPLDLIELFVQ